MTTQEIKTLIKEELPTIIQEDEEIYRLILNISTGQFAPTNRKQKAVSTEYSTRYGVIEKSRVNSGKKRINAGKSRIDGGKRMTTNGQKIKKR